MNSLEKFVAAVLSFAIDVLVCMVVAWLLGFEFHEVLVVVMLMVRTIEKAEKL